MATTSFYSHNAINQGAVYGEPPAIANDFRQQRIRASNGTTSSTMTSLSVGDSTGTAATSFTQPPRYSKKIVVVGDGGCGKTCLLISYSRGEFPDVSGELVPNCYGRQR